MRPCKAIQCVQQSFLPFGFALYNSTRQNWVAGTWLENVMFTKKTCRTVYTLCASHFTLHTSVLYLGGTWN